MAGCSMGVDSGEAVAVVMLVTAAVVMPVLPLGVAAVVEEAAAEEAAAAADECVVKVSIRTTTNTLIQFPLVQQEPEYSSPSTAARVQQPGYEYSSPPTTAAAVRTTQYSCKAVHSRTAVQP
jgi:type II secretory pathway pseudopilin PulG